MIAESLAAACRDPGVLARLGGPLGEQARACARDLAALSSDARKVRRAAWAAAARAPVPAGIRGIDASWIEHALATLPARTRDDLASGGRDPAGVWLARWATAGLAPLPAADLAGPPPTPADAARLTAHAIVGWLADAGADQLAVAIGSAGSEALRRTAAVVGDRLVVAAARITRPPRAGALGPTRAAIARCKLALADDALVRIGARAVAPYLDALGHRQLVLRLPRPRGLVIAGELARHARDPRDAAPRWAALTCA